jgi:uncharacterized protein YdaU (DUF1376 family)
MHWYKRHVGDYAARTGHLTLLEHGVLILLLDRLHESEKPFTSRDAHRICRPKSKQEKAAVESVLEEFFTHTSSGYVSEAAFKQIEEYHANVRKKSKAAQTRWMQVQSECNADAMLSKNQEPITKNNKERVAGYSPSPKPEVYRDGNSPSGDERWLSVVGSANGYRSGG